MNNKGTCMFMHFLWKQYLYS